MKSKLTLSLALLALIVGCGGSKEPNAPASANLPGAAEKAKSSGSSSKGAQGKSKGKGSQAQSSPGAAAPRKLTRKQIQKKLDTIPLPKRYTFARTAALTVLKSLGFPGASILLTNDGRVVLVTIPRSYACEVNLADVPKVAKAIKKIVLFARKVKVGVADNGGSLKSYVRKHCKPLELPTASGAVAYDNQGTGLRGSPEFDIKSNRWTLSYENRGGALEIYITKGKELVDYVKTDQRGVGKKVLPGPGTFRVTVTGSGNWSVRVYDGT